MIISRRSTRLLRYAGIFLIVAMLAYMSWDGLNGWGNGGVCAGLSLLLVAGMLFYLKQMEKVSADSIIQQIRIEYTPETQLQVQEIYEHLKTRELEGLFPKILDDAHGDITLVRKLSGIAEQVGWQAFLENKW
jgi:hypothetical protein